MAKDIRYNYYNIIEYNTNKWSKNWTEFSGFSYIPGVTEWENWMFDILNPDSLHEYMQQKWHYSVYISIGYIILIPLLKQWMKMRGKPYNLRTLLTFWNSFLAVFSIIGVIRCLPEFVHILSNKGFTASFFQSDYYKDSRLNWWYLLFVWSKVIELIDTLFILLRNGKLLTLHWVHHVLTLCYSWYAFGDVPATARWMVAMNLIAHSLMYTYYALKAIRISIPHVISISITTIQILQMVFGLYINYTIIGYKNTGIPCDASLSVVTSGLALYTLFLVLFTNFFVNAYLLKPKNQMKIRVNNNVTDNKLNDKLLINNNYINSKIVLFNNHKTISTCI